MEKKVTMMQELDKEIVALMKARTMEPKNKEEEEFKEKAPARLKVIRGLRSDILLEAKGKKIEESAITDDMFLLVAKRVVGSANKAIEKGKGKENQAAELTREVVSEYLPKQLTADETKELGEKLMAENEFKNFGELIRAIQKESKGSVDGKVAAQVARELFQG